MPKVSFRVMPASCVPISHVETAAARKPDRCAGCEAWCPRRGSNPHFVDFKSTASASWATGAPHTLGDGRQCRVNDWFAAPVNVQICSGVPSAELGPVASRHLPDAGFSSRLPEAVNCWAPVPMQSYSWTRDPFSVPAEPTSLLLPSARKVREDAVHCWAFVPLHVY